MSDLSPGTLVAGRYAIVRLLGRGATKLVYLADDRLSGTPVALALLNPDILAADPTLDARFSREGRAASALRSPYIVRVFDLGKLADGTRYLVTEAVLGRDLADALRHGPLEAPLATRFALQVLAALSEAHARGVLHRDVKPENVLLARGDADGEIARLTDFGLAKVLDGALEGSVMLRTAQNIVLGTPDYMPPEQWQGGPTDHRSDLYAAGVMLYEMLTGRPPFESRAIHAICVGHMTQPPPAFPARLSDAARALEPVAARALAKRPADRFQSADEMRAAIEHVSGIRLPRAAGEPTDRVIAPRSMRAELVCEAWPGAVRLVATPSVVLGRDESCHVRVQCLPANDENTARSRTVSRQHAQLDWRGGRAWVSDLGSASGTRVGAQQVTAAGAPVALANGDEIALGPHVRLVFEHAPCARGELPRWARLVRTDPSGSGQVDVLVLTEAKISAAPDAAVWVPAGRAGGDALRVRADASGLAVLPIGSPHAVPLHDGQTLRLGSLVISVAVER